METLNLKVIEKQEVGGLGFCATLCGAVCVIGYATGPLALEAAGLIGFSS